MFWDAVQDFIDRFRAPQSPQKRIEVVTARGVELDPSKRYLIILDSSALAPEEAQYLLSEMHKQGMNHAVAMMVDGDPTTAVQIVESQ